MSKPRGRNQKNTLRPNIDIKIGIRGTESARKNKLRPIAGGGGNIPPVPGDNVINGILTQAGDFIITQSGDYLIY